MKKSWIVFLLVVTMLVCIVAISACDHNNNTTNGGDDGADHVHSFVNYEVVTPATCTEDGVEVAKCEECDETYSRTIFATGHSWGTPTTVDATCVEAGYISQKCSVCNETEQTDFVSALGHDWNISAATCTEGQVCLTCKETGEPARGHMYDAGYIDIPVSCEEDGYMVYSCEDCDATHREVYAKATGHTLGDARMLDQQEGCVHTYTYLANCTTCNNDVVVGTETETIHTYKSRIADVATCSHEGAKTYTCVNCNDSYDVKYIDANAHKWVKNGQVGDTVTYVCNHDGAHTKVVVSAAGTHATVSASDLKSAGELELDSASITLDDSAKGVLNGKTNVTVGAETLDSNDEVLSELDSELANRVDGPIYNFTMSADGDTVTNFGGKVTIKIPYTLGVDEDPEDIVIWYIEGTELTLIKATYTEVDGQGYAVFETEHFSYYTVTRMTAEERCQLYGHNYVTKSQTADCIRNGFVLEICTRCGHKAKDEIIPAFGHDWDMTTVAATCTEDGKVTQTCKTCDVTVETTLFATGHKWVLDASNSVVATCDHSGVSYFDCDVCDATYKVTEAQKAHRWQTTLVDPTCTSEGYTLKTCANCGTEIRSDVVAALGHNMVDTVIDPTCTTDGFTMHKCSRCDYRGNDTDFVDALGHDLVNGVCSRCGEGCAHNWQQVSTVEATCTEGGYTMVKCSKCGTEKKENVTDALGHDFGVEECSRCHTLNPALADYYENLLNSLFVKGLAVKVTDVEVLVTTEYIINGELDETEVVAHITMDNIAEIMLAIDGDYVFGAGYGSVTVTANDYLGNGIYVPVDHLVTAKVIVDGRNVYLIIEGDESMFETGVMYNMVDFDSIFGGGFTYDMLCESLNWLQNDAFTLISNIVDHNSAAINSMIKTMLGILFVAPEATADGYIYVLDGDALVQFNDDLATLTISQTIDKYFGDNAFEDFATGVKDLLSQNLVELFFNMDKYGLGYDGLCAAIDVLMLSLTGEPFDADAMFQEYFATGGPLDAPIADIVAAYAGMVDEDGNEMLTVMVDEYVEIAKDYALYTLFVGEEVEYLQEILGQYINLVNDGFEVSFSTDKDGNITSFDIDANGEKLLVSGSLNDNGVVINERKNYLTVSGKVSVIFNGSFDVDFESELIAKVKATARLGKNINATVNRDDRYNTLEIHTDANGNLTSMISYFTEITSWSGGGYGEYDGQWLRFYDCRQEIEVRTFLMTNGYNVMASEATICNGWQYISISGMASISTMYRYVRVYVDEDGNTVGTSQLQDDEWRGEEYVTKRSVYFYCNTLSGEISLDNPHSYVLDETNSVAPTGCTDIGYYAYFCELCGESYKDYYANGHRHTDVQTTLLGGEGSTCEDGVRIVEKCLDCGEILVDTTEYGHYTYKIILDTADYGSVCGGTIEIRRCACGYNVDVYTYDIACEMYSRTVNGVTTYMCAVTNCPFEYTRTHTEYYDRDNCMYYVYYNYAFGTNTSNPYTVSEVWSRNTSHDWESDGDSYWTEGMYGDLYTQTYYYTSMQVCKVCGRREGTDETEIYYYTSEYYYYNSLVQKHSDRTEYYDGASYRTVEDITYSLGSYEHDVTSRRIARYDNGRLSNEESYTYDFDPYGRHDSLIYLIYSYNRLGNFTYTYVGYDSEGRVSRKESETITVLYNYAAECYYDLSIVRTYEWYSNGEMYDYDMDESYYSYRENHIDLHSQHVSDSTCTQDSVYYVTCDTCGYSENEPEFEWNNGHWYEYDPEKGLFVCVRCGLENSKYVDGPIILEDLTEREDYAKDGYYVIGYNFNRYHDDYYYWWERVFMQHYHPYGFTVVVDLVDEYGNELALNINVEVEVRNDDHTLVYVNVADIEAVAAQLGLEDYGIMISFLFNDASGLACNITLDPSEYAF